MNQVNRQIQILASQSHVLHKDRKAKENPNQMERNLLPIIRKNVVKGFHASIRNARQRRTIVPKMAIHATTKTNVVSSSVI